MPLTIVQRRTNQSAADVASLAITFLSTPVQGNLLVASVNSDATVTMTSSGWSLANSSVNTTGLYQWYKIAGAAESTTVTVTPGGSASTEMVVEEWTGNVSSSPLDKTASQATGSGSTASSGTTATTTQADDLAIAAFGWNDIGGVITGSTYSGGFSEVAETKGLGTTATNITVAEAALAAIGAITTTMTLSGSTGQTKSALIATYKAAPVGISGSSDATASGVAGEFSPHLNYRMWL